MYQRLKERRKKCACVCVGGGYQGRRSLPLIHCLCYVPLYHSSFSVCGLPLCQQPNSRSFYKSQESCRESPGIAGLSFVFMSVKRFTWDSFWLEPGKLLTWTMINPCSQMPSHCVLCTFSKILMTSAFVCCVSVHLRSDIWGHIFV